MSLRFFIWNCQGAASNGFLRVLKSFINEFRPRVVVLVEPRVALGYNDKIIRRTGFEFSHRVESNGYSGGIWILWNNRVDVKVLVNHRQFVHSVIKMSDRDQMIFFTAIYGSQNPTNRKDLWEDLTNTMAQNRGPWLLGGDFNALLTGDERKGGSSRPRKGCSLLKEFVDRNHLMDLGFVGPKLTRRRGTLLERLDRALCNNEWAELFPDCFVQHLPKMKSDHRPILVKSDEMGQRSNEKRPFQFLAAWLGRTQFHDLLSRVWNNGDPLTTNIQPFTEEAERWNRESFGHIMKRKKRIRARLEGIEKALEDGDSEFLLDLEKRLKDEYEEICAQEELLWLQKSRTDWINSGDRKTRFDHAKAASRRIQNKIRMRELLER